MPESIEVKLKWAAIMLADKLSYSNAAEELNMTPAELKRQISALETQLCFHIFRPRRKRVELTDEGKFLVEAFRRAVVLHDRSEKCPLGGKGMSPSC